MIQPIQGICSVGDREPRPAWERRSKVPEGFGALLEAKIKEATMKSRQQTEAEAALGVLKQFVGKRVVGLALAEDDDVGPTVGLTFEGGKTVYFDQDPEGNGPGWPAVEG